MKRTITLLLAALLGVGTLFAHDMYLKLESFFLSPDTDATIALLNGTFDASANAISRDRMIDVSIAGPNDERVHPGENQWRDADSTAFLDFRTGPAGTYVAGVSTAARFIDLTAEEFNEYLEHDGVVDVLAAREAQGILDRGARERYSKHVKAVFQVGSERSMAYATVLGYPIEFVPLENPYDLAAGDTVGVLLLLGGAPLGGQAVYASYDGHHGHDGDGGHVEAVRTRTDADGVAFFPLGHAGRWYVRTIHMTAVDGADHDYESNWATLTFEVR